MLLQRLTLMLFVVCQSIMVQAQLHFYSDLVKGGFVGDGYTAWYYGNPSTINLPIPPGSVIKRAFFFQTYINGREM